MLLALIVALAVLCSLTALFWLAARRITTQADQIAFLLNEKAKFDTLTSIIQNTITTGGWLTVGHNGNQIPFGPLLDKMDSQSDKVH